MKKLTAGDDEARSKDIVAANIERLRTLFPEVLTEGPDGTSVNADVLRQLVGDKTLTDSDEKYGLNWHGKRQARQLALAPSTGTLRPSPEDSEDWNITQNLMIEGDNVEVLKLLQKSYAGKVKLIYIDPPYNTGSDLVYRDSYKDSLRQYLEMTRQVDAGQAKLSSNTESSGRFHTAWLNMLYPRLYLARNLLSRDGAIFVSIDDHEVASLRIIMNEIFGEENFLAVFLWKKMDSPSRNDADRVVSEYHDYIVAYARSKDAGGLRQLPKPEILEAYPLVLEDGRRARRRQLRKNGKAARREDRPSMWYKLTAPDGKDVWPIAPPPDQWEGRWTLKKKTWLEREAAGETQWIKRKYGWVPYCIEYAPEEPSVPWSTWWGDLSQNRQAKAAFTELMRGSGVTFDNPKPVDLVTRMIDIAGGENGVVFDFFAGSGTTGHAVFEKNAADGGKRRFILVQLPEPLQHGDGTLSTLTQERLRRAAGKIKDASPMFAGDLGFRVFKLDTSNIRAWEPDQDDLDGSLQESIDHLKTDRTEEDILYELLLKLGLDLCVPMETRDIAGKEVHAVGGGVLLTCLAEEIAQGDVEALAQGIVEWHQALAPVVDSTCVFRDSAFADDVAKTNMAAILQQRGIKHVRSI